MNDFILFSLFFIQLSYLSRWFSFSFTRLLSDEESSVAVSAAAAFADCAALRYVVLPSTSVEIAEDAFDADAPERIVARGNDAD